MSIIFGMLKNRGDHTSEQELHSLAAATERYAPDGLFIRSRGRIGMGFQPYHTHQRSNFESQPAIDAVGNVLTFDGRLDNHKELRNLLGIDQPEIADSQIVLSAFEHWGEESFSRFAGDWALALWSSRNCSLYLARDHAGTKTLYFEQTSDGVLWSTYLETFLAGKQSRDLDGTFAACYLTCQPSRDLTPYKGVSAVTPAHYRVFRDDTTIQRAHWRWITKGLIRYKADVDYEEHFRALFRCSVKRRTGAGSPILAHLSGGMDSSSIVCMSDFIRGSEGVRTEDLLDTISYYDDTEPHWDERTYFSVVERHRGKVGSHIDVSANRRTFEAVSRSEAFYNFPGADSSSLRAERDLRKLTVPFGFRVILSGIGGDELLGGVPTVLPELADHLVAGESSALLRTGATWCALNRTPMLHLLLDTVKFSLKLYYLQGRSRLNTLPPWLTPHLSHLIRSQASQFLPERPSLFLRPSAIESGYAWWKMLETMPHQTPGYVERYEYRYPFLDRDLVDFLLRIPREQLVRPGRRRFLMRRAMKLIVPIEVLERRRKGYLSRSPMLSLLEKQNSIESRFKNSLLSAHGFAESSLLIQHLRSAASCGVAMWIAPLMRAVLFETWLRSLYGAV